MRGGKGEVCDKFHHELGIFLISKQSPVLVFSFIPTFYEKELKSLFSKRNLFIFFRTKDIKNGLLSSPYSIKGVEIHQCKLRKAIINIWIKGDIQWLHELFRFLRSELGLIPSLYHECADKWVETLNVYFSKKWLRTPLLTLDDILILQRNGEDLEELREIAVGYSYLTKC